METNEHPNVAEAIKQIEEQNKKPVSIQTEIKGEDYFELGGRKFSKDVTLGAAIKVLEENNRNGIREITDAEFVSFSLHKLGSDVLEEGLYEARELLNIRSAQEFLEQC